MSYLYRTIIHCILLIITVSILAFTLVNLSPIDPVNAYIGTNQTNIGLEQREAITKKWGLDKSPVERFSLWFENVLQGDFGESLIYQEPVSSVISSRFTASLVLMGGAWILSGLLGFGLGIIAGFKENTWIDTAINTYAYLLASAPTFWIGMLLLMFFSVYLGITPICCATPHGVLAVDVTIWQKIHHLILPMVTLSLTGTSAIILHTRQKVVDVMKSDFALFAQAQGIAREKFLWTQGLRHISLPAITIHLASFGELFGGSILAEQVFAYPGLGQAAVQAGLRGDVPLLLGLTLCSAVFIYFGNLTADISYHFLDPRIRLEGMDS